jgi:hypothetical protein
MRNAVRLRLWQKKPDYIGRLGALGNEAWRLGWGRLQSTPAHSAATILNHVEKASVP